MSNGFKSIKQGLDEAIDHAKGKPVKAVIHEFKPVDVKRIRAKVGMIAASIYGGSNGNFPAR